MLNQPGYLILLVLVSVVNAASQILTRWGGVQATQPSVSPVTVWAWLWVSRWWLSGIMVGWISGLGWAWCLRRLPLGLAVPLYAGLAYALSILSAVCILKERMSGGQIAGIAVILVGVLLVTLSASSSSGAYSRQQQRPGPRSPRMRVYGTSPNASGPSLKRSNLHQASPPHAAEQPVRDRRSSREVDERL